ncbi:MAG TPA: hypothetical protein VFN29_03495 [Chiayiivirga sp.]|nr:hypothetical protein [Chiayiivirga sp.]
MGLLDELEQEAARRNADEAGEAERLAREKHWKEQLQPAAVRLGEYLTRFGKSLVAAERRIRLSYAIAGYGEVVAFGEAPFDCRIVPGAAQHEIEFVFAAQASPGDCTLVVADTPSKVRFIGGILQNHHLSGLHDVSKNANGEVISGRFQARGRIPVKVHAVASAESGNLKLSVSNVEAFGILTSTWTADALTDEAFDRIGRYLLRDLPTLSREKLDANTRRQLQSQIQRDQIKREWEAKLSMQLREDEAKVIALMAPSASPRAFATRAWSAVARAFRRGE